MQPEDQSVPLLTEVKGTRLQIYVYHNYNYYRLQYIVNIPMLHLLHIDLIACIYT